MLKKQADILWFDYFNGPILDPTITTALVFVFSSNTICESGAGGASVVNGMPAAVNASLSNFTVEFSGPGSKRLIGRTLPHDADIGIASHFTSSKTLVNWEPNTKASGSLATIIKVIFSRVAESFVTRIFRLSAEIDRQTTSCFKRSVSRRALSARSLAFAAIAFALAAPSEAFAIAKPASALYFSNVSAESLTASRCSLTTAHVDTPTATAENAATASEKINIPSQECKPKPSIRLTLLEMVALGICGVSMFVLLGIMVAVIVDQLKRDDFHDL